MNYKAINTHRSSSDRAFEAMCNQLFERWLRRIHGNELKNFVVVNGAGGDGGVEAYGELQKGKFIGVQAKYFTEKLAASQVKEIENSIETARNVRSGLKEYIICIPRDLTNKKVVSKVNKTLAKHTDYAKTQAMITKYKLLLKGLKIVFWGAHELNAELERLENIGTRKLWFDNAVIDLEKMKNRFTISKSDWLAPRYVPDLHLAGFMQGKIDQHLYTPAFRSRFALKLRQASSNLHQVLDGIGVMKSELNRDVGNKFKGWLAQCIKAIDTAITQVSEGKVNLSMDFPPNVYVPDFYEELKAIGLPPQLKNQEESLRSYISRIDFTEIEDDILASKVQYLVFSGAAGTGKTHALSNTTDKILAANCPAIIIQAKDAPCDNLGAVLKYGFAAFASWDEEDILSALESLAHTCEVERAVQYTTLDTFEPIKTVICLDGIDEVKRLNWEKWTNLINSLSAQIKLHPRLQFVVSCRNSFRDSTELSQQFPAKFYRLPVEGDVDVKLLFEKYTDTYNAPNDPWIKFRLNGILALKLFCKLYENERGKPIPLATSLTALIRAQLFQIQKEINETYRTAWSKEDQVLEKVMSLIASQVIRDKKLAKHWLVEKIAAKVKGVKKKQARNILQALCEYGILRLEKEASLTDPLIDNYHYKATYESILEFLLASEIVKNVIEKKVKVFPKDLIQRKEIREMAAEILIRDHGILPGTNDIWNNLGQAKLEEVTIKSIPEAREISEQFVETGKRQFNKSFKGRDQIFQDWIMKSLGAPGQPFDPMYLHNILASYPSTYKRDLIWSGPDYAQDRNGLRIADYLGNLTLDIDYSFNDLPLIFAWSLTSVDNLYRDHAKTQLTNWAHYNLAGFLSILELLFNKYDPQLDEDLGLILLGTASIQSNPSPEFKLLADWIVQYVFDPEKIRGIRNATVRHCCRAFVERSFMLGLTDKTSLRKSRPPYLNTFEYIPLDMGKPTGTEGQRKPIVGDLAWYVIKYSYEHLLEYDLQSKNSPTAKFFQRYKSAGYKERLDPLTFAIAAAISYIKSLGWEDSGLSDYTAESHGGLSKISTYPEKYTWVAVNYIKGFLADQLPFQSSDPKDRLKDYSQFLKLKNPANDIINDALFPQVSGKWILPGELSPRMVVNPANPGKEIKAWVQRQSDFELKPWYEIASATLKALIEVPARKKWLVLDNDTTIKESNALGSSSFRTTAFLIKEDQFDTFIDAFKTKGLSKQSDFEIDHLQATPETDFYISPIDVIWMKWLNEEDQLPDNGMFDTVTAISKVITTEKQRETTYLMPSKKLRTWLGISSGNGKVFLNDQKAIVGVYNEIGEHYYDYQRILLVDQALLKRKLKSQGYKIVWSVFMFKRGEFKQEGKTDIYYQDCELSLVWQDGTEYRQFLYHKGRNR